MFGLGDLPMHCWAQDGGSEIVAIPAMAFAGESDEWQKLGYGHVLSMRLTRNLCKNFLTGAQLVLFACPSFCDASEGLCLAFQGFLPLAKDF